jgi:hypothetical protein
MAGKSVSCERNEQSWMCVDRLWALEENYGGWRVDEDAGL